MCRELESAQGAESRISVIAGSDSYKKNTTPEVYSESSIFMFWRSEGRGSDCVFKARRTYQKFCVRGRVIKLMDRVCKTFAEQNGELVSGLLPGPLRHLPIFLDIAQGQEQ